MKKPTRHDFEREMNLLRYTLSEIENDLAETNFGKAKERVKEFKESGYYRIMSIFNSLIPEKNK